MQLHQASHYVQMRFAKNNHCPICGHTIDKFDQFEYVTVPCGKTKKYVFLHWRCLLWNNPLVDQQERGVKWQERV